MVELTLRDIRESFTGQVSYIFLCGPPYTYSRTALCFAVDINREIRDFGSMVFLTMPDYRNARLLCNTWYEIAR